MRQDSPTPFGLDGYEGRYHQPIDCTPFGLNSGDVESLSGYLQRLARSMCLPTAALLNSMVGLDDKEYRRGSANLQRNLSRIDCLPPAIEPLSGWTQQPPAVLEQLTFLPLFTAFNGRERLTKNHLIRFFFPSKNDSLIADERRWCPLCLCEQFYYRLSWQLRELLICPTHHIYLMDRCSKCNKTSPVLAPASYFGHCYYCRFPVLTSRKAGRATGAAFLERQHRIANDYVHLLSHGIGLDRTDGETTRATVRARLRTVRLERNVSIADEKRLACRQVATIYETRDRTITLSAVRALLGFHKISIAEFGTIRPTAPRHGDASPDMMCANPWCPAYGCEARSRYFDSGNGCRTCGARAVRHSEKRCGIPIRQLLQGVFRLYTDDEAHGKIAFVERFRSAGLPSKKMSRVMDRLKSWGFAKGSSKTGWTLCHETSLQKWHFPVTPAIALLARKWDSDVSFVRREKILSAINALFHRDELVNSNRIATELNITKNVLYHWLDQLPRDRSAILNHLKTVRHQQKRNHIQGGLHQIDEILASLTKDGTPITKNRVFALLPFRIRYDERFDPTTHAKIEGRIEAAAREQLRHRREQLKAEMVKAAEQVWANGRALSMTQLQSHLRCYILKNKEFESWYWDLKALERGHYPSCKLRG